MRKRRRSLPKDKDQRVHAGRFHAADGADAEHGYGKHAIHGSGHGRRQAGQRTDRRKAAKKTLAIIKSMTPKERAKPELLNASRRRRIAAGSGNSVQEVNRLLNQFESSRKLMKQLSSGKFGKRKDAFSLRLLSHRLPLSILNNYKQYLEEI